MTDATLSEPAEVSPETSRPKTYGPLQLFFWKTVIVTCVAGVPLFLIVDSFTSRVSVEIRQLSGPVFWSRIEQKLYKFADEPELPPEQKAKIIAALKRISEKNKPFVDALFGK